MLFLRLTLPGIGAGCHVPHREIQSCRLAMQNWDWVLQPGFLLVCSGLTTLGVGEGLYP
jgi:hypothetical protein